MGGRGACCTASEESCDVEECCWGRSSPPPTEPNRHPTNNRTANYKPTRDDVDITDAYNLLAPTLGAKAASIVFAVALLASGQNSTITGTLAGQIVLEGFLEINIRPWLRRLLTRGAAIVPAAVVAASMGDAAVGKLLILSQVVLSLQLSFAVFPLVHFTTSKKFTGKYASGWAGTIIAWTLAVAIAGLNGYLLIRFAMGEGL
jgi:manganese transport protein